MPRARAEETPHASDPAPVAGPNLLDELSEAEFQALKGDIAKRGLVTPIIVDAATGQVVDGAHRLRACKELGIEPTVIRRVFASEEARDEEALLLNMMRRQLGSVTAWGKAFAKLLEIRGVERGRLGRPTNGETRMTLAEVAAELGVPERTARWRIRMWEELAAHPDLASAVDAGELPSREALRVAAIREQCAKRDQPPLETQQPTTQRTSDSSPGPRAEATDAQQADGGERFRVVTGDCLEVLRTLPDASFSSLVTDPPSGADAAGAEWDEDRGGRDAWIAWLRERAAEMLRVMLPGAHGFVWALPRTSHWTATAFEDAGWQIVDVFTHHFADGIPKTRDLGEAVARIDPASKGRWEGWRAGVAPGSEHWLLVRRPLARPTTSENLLDFGVGALNIEASRVGDRWPRNVLYSHAEGCRLVGLQEAPSNSHWPARRVTNYSRTGSVAARSAEQEDRWRRTEMVEEWDCIEGCPLRTLGDRSRFVWAAKPASEERAEGLPEDGGRSHEAQKSVALMTRLVTLCTPPGGRVLDPFCGSGSTGCAALRLDTALSFTGIEERADYAEVARRRLGLAGRCGRTAADQTPVAEGSDGVRGAA